MEGAERQKDVGTDESTWSALIDGCYKCCDLGMGCSHRVLLFLRHLGESMGRAAEKVDGRLRRQGELELTSVLPSVTHSLDPVTWPTCPGARHPLLAYRPTSPPSARTSTQSVRPHHRR